MKDYNNPNLIHDNIVLDHLLDNQKTYLSLALLLVLLILPLINFVQGQPLIKGGESYYHLNQAEDTNWWNVNYLPLQLAATLLNEQQIMILPILLALISIHFFLILAHRFNLSKQFTFFFLALMIISPSFIRVFTTISTYSYFTFLILLSFVLLTYDGKNKVKSQQNAVKNTLYYLHYLAAIPLILASLIDLVSTILVAGLVLVYLIKNKSSEISKQHKAQNIFISILLGVLGLIFLINIFFFPQSLVLGSFHEEKIVSDFISDLGGREGVSFFTFLLSFIGLAFTWKRKKFYFVYFFLPLVILFYIYNTQTSFLLSVTIAFFAAIGLIKLFAREWVFDTLKKFTLLLLILGMIFSTITYLDRSTSNQPVQADIETFSWIRGNTLSDSIIFSDPQNSYYIKYFTGSKPFLELHQNNIYKEKTMNQIYSALYINELFPLLEENKITHLYITPKMRSQIPDEQGLLFLLKNERFKLLHTHEGREVWMFSNE